MDLKIIYDIEEFKLYKKEWQEIIIKNNNCNPFLEFDFIIKWWEIFGQKHKLLIIVAMKNNKVLGFCPLMKTKKKLYYLINYIGYRKATYMDMNISSEFRKEVVETFLNYLVNLNGNNIVFLHGMDSATGNFDIIEKFLSKANMSNLIQKREMRYIDTNINEFEKYYKTRRKKYRSIRKIKTKEKRLRQLGNVSIKKIENDRIDEIFVLHDKRWQKKNDVSNFSKGKIKQLYKQLILDKNMPFESVVFGLYLNDRLIAFTYIINYKSTSKFCRMAHDDIFYVYVPGKIILKEMIKRYFIENKIIDFGTGYERYKSRWTDDLKYINNIIFPSKNIISKSIYSIFYLKGKIKEFFKKYEKFIYFKRNTLGKIKYYFSVKYWKSQYNRIKNITLQRGIFNTLRFFVEKICTRKKYIVFAKELDKYSNINNTSDILNYYVSEFTIDDLEAMSNLMNIKPQYVIKKFAKRDRCFTVVDNGEIVSYMWICFNGISLFDHKFIELEKNSVCIYEKHTKKGYNDKMISEMMINHITKLLDDIKVNKFYIIINKKDEALKKIALKSMFCEEYLIKYTKTFNKNSYSINPIVNEKKL